VDNPANCLDRPDKPPGSLCARATHSVRRSMFAARRRRFNARAVKRQPRLPRTTATTMSRNMTVPKATSIRATTGPPTSLYRRSASTTNTSSNISPRVRRKTGDLGLVNFISSEAF
jgi:hypothetical protein